MQPYTHLLIGPIEERTPDGLSITGDASRHSDLSPPAQILAFMSLIRVATLGQLARFHSLPADNNGSRSIIESKEQIEALVFTTGWLGYFKTTLPSSCGGGMVTVFHLTERGRKALRKEAPVLCLFAAGRPSKRNIKYVAHNLLVTEALLCISESGCEVLEFQPESSLRRMKVSERGEEWRNTTGQSESLPDFSVLLRTPKNTFRRVDCEISIQLDAEQIKKKPIGVHWFVPNQSKSDLVESVRSKRERVTVLGDVRAPFVDDESESPNIRQEPVKDTTPAPFLDESDVHVLQLLGGIASANAIAAIRKAERSGVSRSLSRLVRKGHLRRSEVKLQPGRDKGRPTALFVLSSVSALSFAARKKALIMSLMVAEMAGKSFILKSYELTNGILSMVHADFEDEPPVVMVVDDESLPIESIAETILSCQRADAHGAQLLVAMADGIRVKRLGILFPNLDICDVSA